MKSRFRLRTLLGLGLVLALGVVAFLRTRVAWDAACGLAREQLPALLKADVGIVACEVDPLSQSLTLREVAAFDRVTHARLFSAESIQVGVIGFSPLRRRLELGHVVIKRPQVALDLSAPGPAAMPESKKRGACGLDALKRLQVSRLDVQGAQVQVRLPDARRVELSGLNVGWRTRRGTTGEFEIETSEGVLNAGNGGADVALSGLRLEGSLDPSALELKLSRGELTLEDMNVALSGQVSELCHPRLALDAQVFLPLRTLGKLGGLHTVLGGHAWAHVTASGVPEDVRLTAELLGRGVQLADFRPGDFSARLSLSGPDVTLHELSFNAGSGGKVRAEGGLKLAPGLPLHAQVDLKNASFGHILERTGLPGAWVDFAGTGKVTVGGKLLPAPHLQGELELVGEKFALTPHAFDQPSKESPLLAFPRGKVKTSFKVLPDHVEMAPAHVQVERASADGVVSLYFDPAKGMEINARSEQLELADVGPLAGIPWRGRGSATVQIAGPYGEVKIDGSATFRDFDFSDYSLGTVQTRLAFARGVLAFPYLQGQKGRTAYSGAGELDFRGPELVTRGKAQLPHGRLEDVVDILARLSPSIAVFQGDATGDVSGSLDLVSPGTKLGGTVDLALSRISYLGRRLGDGNVELTFKDGETMSLARTTFKGPLGALTAEGVYNFDGPLELRLGVEGLDAAEVVGPERAQKLGIGGALSFAAKVEGTSDVPQVSAYLTSPRITFADRSLGAVHMEALLNGRDLQIYGKPFGESHASMKLKVAAPYPYEAELQLALPEIRPLLPDVAASQGLSGSLAGSFNATGNLSDAHSLKVGGTVSSLNLNRGDFSGHIASPVSLAYSRGRLDVDLFQLDGPNTELALGGSYGPSTLDVKMRGTLDMRLLESFVPELERSGGTVELSASASGPINDPSLVGSAEIRDARLSVRDQPVQVRALQGRLNFSAARVLLEDVTGVLNDGRMSLRGDLLLNHFKPERVDVGLQMDDVHWRVAEDLPFVTSGELLLTGPLDNLSLGGDLDVAKLKYDHPLAIESFLRRVSKGTVVPQQSNEWLNLDVWVHLKDVRMDNNLARAKLLGNLKLTGTNVHPGLLGNLEAGEGSQAFFRGTDFTVTQGVMEFKSRNGLDGLFDLHAETTVHHVDTNYLVRLHAFGRPSDPQLLLSSEPALAESDIISLLTLGMTSHDKQDTLKAGIAGIGVGADVLFTASGLDKQVQRFLPRNDVLRDLSFHLSSTYSDVTGLVEPTVQLESKFLTEQLKLRMTQPVSGRGTRAQAEYRFDDRVSAQAQWDNEHSDNSATVGNLGLDLKLRWEIE